MYIPVAQAYIQVSIPRLNPLGHSPRTLHKLSNPAYMDYYGLSMKMMILPSIIFQKSQPLYK